MTCTEVRSHWMLYLDSEGDSELHFRISDHLGMCPACAEWFHHEQRFEQALRERLQAGEATPELWGRVLASAGGVRPKSSRRTWLVRGGLMVVAAALLLAVGVGFWLAGRTPPTPERPGDLPALAVAQHERLLTGDVRPDLESTSDQEVDRYLKANVPFSVHCPPEKDVNFAVRGAGLCKLKDERLAAYIVGRVGDAPVSILVLDHSALAAFPEEGAHLQAGDHRRCSEGRYEMVSGVVAGNLVVVVGSVSPDDLERLLSAYGSYPEG